MAFDLPPAIPPQFVETAYIKQHVSGSAPISVKNGNYVIDVWGNRHLQASVVERILSVAKDPAAGLINLSDTYKSTGHILMFLRYAVDRNHISVLVSEGVVKEVQGPKGIDGHFDSIVGDNDLTFAELETPRVLANLRGERAGIDYTSSFKTLDGAPEALAFVIEEHPQDDPDRNALTLRVHNGGSRFSDRNFGHVDFRHNFRSGGQFVLGYDQDLKEGDYKAGSLKFDQPTGAGLYGLTANHIQYEQTVIIPATAGGGTTGTPLDAAFDPLVDALSGSGSATSAQAVDLEGKISQAALTGDQVLFSDSKTRISLFEKGEYVTSEIETASSGQLVQEEKYGTLEVGARYVRSLRGNAKSASQLALKASVGGGITDDDGTLGTDNRDNAVAIGRRTAEYLAVKPAISLRLGNREGLQWLNALTAQLVEDEQVPQQQQWVLGGLSSMSAWLPGVLIGDSGTYFKTELSYHGFQFGWGEIVPAVFWEAGSAEYNASGDGGETRTLTDGGLRITMKLPWNIEIQGVVAHELSSEQISDDRLDEFSVDGMVSLQKIF